MTIKKEWYPKYWASVDKKPVLRKMVVTRYDHVQDRAGVQGKKVGYLGVPTQLLVDANEDSGGDIRIVEVIGYEPKPVPAQWERAQLEREEQEREWWVDKTALAAVGDDVAVKKYLLTIDPIGGNSVVEL